MNEAILKDRLINWVGTNHDTQNSKFWELKECRLEDNIINFQYSAKRGSNELIIRTCSLEIGDDGDWINYKIINTDIFGPTGEF